MVLSFVKAGTGRLANQGPFMDLHASECVVVWQQEPWVKNYIRTEGDKEETDTQKGTRNDKRLGIAEEYHGNNMEKRMETELCKPMDKRMLRKYSGQNATL